MPTRKLITGPVKIKPMISIFKRYGCGGTNFKVAADGTWSRRVERARFVRSRGVDLFRIWKAYRLENKPIFIEDNFL